MRTQKAFSLLELLFAFAAFSLIGITMLSTLIQVSKTSRLAGYYAEELSERTRCIQRLREELFHVKHSLTKSSILVQERSVAQRPLIRFYTASGEQGVIEVAYRLIEVEGELVFQRREFPHPVGLAFQEEYFHSGSLGSWETICDSVVGWSISFSDDGIQFEQGWSSETIPQAIRLELEFLGDEAEEATSIDTVVYPVAGDRRW